LLGKAPLSIRNQGFPTSEVDLAFAIRHVEQSCEEAPLRSHRVLGIRPTAVENFAKDVIRPFVPPGLRIDGWIMRINWSILRNGWGSSKYRYDDVPPIYELALLFPEELASSPVWLWGHNFDFQSKELTCPNREFQSIKDGDWVRVFGVLRPDSRVEWEATKSDDLLSLGEMFISHIQRLEAIPN
jgi:hypothetical protein